MHDLTVTLRLFDPAHAPTVVSWVRSDQDLFLLAPSTTAPLTPAKLIGWTMTRGQAFLLFPPMCSVPRGYAELNPIRNDAGQLWLGHVIVDPAYRGHGFGRQMVKLLIDEAFADAGTTKLVLVVFPENAAAIRCYLGCGFRACGHEAHRFANRPGKGGRMLRFEIDASTYRADLQPQSASNAPPAATIA